MSGARRPWPVYSALLAATVLLGLGSRRYGNALPAFVARYGGDALWATMVMWIYALLWPKASTSRLAISALTTAFVVEFSQSYRAPWIDAIRATRPGALALGQGFLWSDLVCYAVGVGIGVCIDAVIRRSDARVESLP
jgi:hypothetical protein